MISTMLDSCPGGPTLKSLTFMKDAWSRSYTENRLIADIRACPPSSKATARVIEKNPKGLVAITDHMTLAMMFLSGRNFIIPRA